MTNGMSTKKDVCHKNEKFFSLQILKESFSFLFVKLWCSKWAWKLTKRSWSFFNLSLCTWVHCELFYIKNICLFNSFNSLNNIIFKRSEYQTCLIFRPYLVKLRILGNKIISWPLCTQKYMVFRIYPYSDPTWRLLM